jgi:ribosomal protein L31
LGGLQFEASPGKVNKTPSQAIKLDIVVAACHPSYTGSINRIMVQAGPGIKWRPNLK